jgi:hypothetical protein
MIAGVLFYDCRRIVFAWAASGHLFCLTFILQIFQSEDERSAEQSRRNSYAQTRLTSSGVAVTSGIDSIIAS